MALDSNLTNAQWNKNNFVSSRKNSVLNVTLDKNAEKNSIICDVFATYLEMGIEANLVLFI